ncbi:ParB N-terminal domain-containing protein [Burkholderia sp. 4M9327F10]|uniref:ParB/RepB/Spo0J family partition protein n=1 Tax=Burkholderia sp. 4M9327F10 TaxID=2502223 RepID=UPI002016CDAF|nr:ParB N-terminal domain-containing protein [Burkholderia sp. 4M9327F10]
MDAQNRINQADERWKDAEQRWTNAEQRIKELEAQVAGQEGDEIEIDTLVEVAGRRRTLSSEAYAELRKNLEQNKLATPILYKSLGNGKRELIAGYNRVAIYRELGRTKIRGVAFEGDTKEIEFAALFSNLLAPSLPDFEKYQHFIRLQDISGLSRDEIAESTGLSKAHVTRIFSFDMLPAEAKLALAASPDRLGSNAAQKLASLAQNGSTEQVIAAVRRLVDDFEFTQEKAVAMATPVKAKNQQATAPTVIKTGKKKFCEVSARNGVVGVRFFGTDSDAAAQWSEKIAAFIRSNMATPEAE